MTRKEQPLGVIIQFGGQTPLNIAQDLASAGVNILGTSPEMIDLAEDRDRFRKVMAELGIPEPESGMASDIDQALAIAGENRLPPDRAGPLTSWAVGPWRSCTTRQMLTGVRGQGGGDQSPERPILIDKFLENAIEGRGRRHRRR